MADNSSMPVPRYSVWQAVNAALALSMRAIEEVRAIAKLPPGKDGKDGEAGQKGDPGVAGRDGEPGQPGKDAPRVIVRGVYDPTQTYADLNVVVLDGSSWIARVKTPTTAPGEGGDWLLLAGRGKRGERGEHGPSGRQGIMGNDAPRIRSWRKDGYKAIPVLSDGTEAVALDLREFFEIYHSESVR